LQALTVRQKEEKRKKKKLGKGTLQENAVRAEAAWRYSCVH
jgi:hypothetical protein